jgi:hypothetical protein
MMDGDEHKQSSEQTDPRNGGVDIDLARLEEIERAPQKICQ